MTRFSNIEVALVTNGSEPFSLLTSNEMSSPGLHAEVESLVREEGAPVNVCGGLATRARQRHSS